MCVLCSKVSGLVRSDTMWFCCNITHTNTHTRKHTQCPGVPVTDTPI